MMLNLRAGIPGYTYIFVHYTHVCTHTQIHTSISKHAQTKIHAHTHYALTYEIKDAWIYKTYALHKKALIETLKVQKTMVSFYMIFWITKKLQDYMLISLKNNYEL